MTTLHNHVAGLSQRPTQRMQWRNTLERFGLRAQLLHALIGFAILVMLPVGFAIDYLPPKAWPAGWQPVIVTFHKGLGLWILLFALLWFVHWKWQTTPAPMPNQRRPLHRLAKLVHRMLLVLCIAMPLSGWVMVSAWGDNAIALAPYFHLPAIAKTDQAFAKAMLGVHVLFAWIITGLLALHVAGVLYHQFIKRDPTLKRMIPRFKPPAGHHRFQFDRAKAYTQKLK